MPEIAAIWLLPALLVGVGVGALIVWATSKQRVKDLERRLIKAKKALQQLNMQSTAEREQVAQLKNELGRSGARRPAASSAPAVAATPAPPPNVLFDSSLIGLRVGDSQTPDFAETQIQLSDRS